jgi:hypothetical protein
MRPHQGIDQNIPYGYDPPDNNSNSVKSKEILGGLHHHYYRDAV